MEMYLDLAEARELCQQAAKEAWEAFGNYIGKTIPNMPTIVWKSFGFRTAGRFVFFRNSYRGDYIEMNINFLYSKDARKFVKSTIRHELAHCINWRYNHSAGHDKYFKVIAQIMGDDGNTYHDYEKPDNAPAKNDKRLTLTCKCGQVFYLTPIRYKRAKEGNYCCKHCHTNLMDLIK